MPPAATLCDSFGAQKPTAGGAVKAEARIPEW